MSDTTLSVLAIIIGCVMAGGNILIRRWRKHHVKALVVVRLNGKEIGRQTMTLRRWDETKKLTGEGLRRFVEDYLVLLDPERQVKIERLSGAGGGCKRKMSIPVLAEPHDTPTELIVQARW